MMIEQKYTSPSLVSKLMGVLALSCIRAVSGLTNPIHMISHPANKVDISLRMFVYTIKVQRQSYLPIYRPSGGDVTVAFLKSDLADTKNPLYEWQSSVFQRGKNMTKEEFVKTDFNFKKVFESFRVLKDNYDAFKPVPTPKTVYRTRKSQRSEVEGLEVSFEYKEVIELVVLDISLQVVWLKT